MQVKQYITSIFKQSVTEGTMDEIWRVVVWSLEALYEGKWPATDHRGVPYPANSAEGLIAGQDLAGGYRGLLWMIKGDLKFFLMT